MNDQDIRDLCAELHIPAHMHTGIVNYVTRGEPTGSFLTAIFANDFVCAAASSDDQNANALFAYAKLLFQLPVLCWGSKEIVIAWHSRGGIDGGQK